MNMILLLMALGRKIREWLELDYMEYSSDANAQAAYVSNATYDSYTKLASHFDGANGATAYTDPIADAATFYGTAQLSTAQYKFGTASLLLDGNSDYVTYPDSDSWYFGTGDFTIDCWVMFTSIATTNWIICQTNNQVSNVSFGLWWWSGGSLVFGYSTNGTSVTELTNSWSPSINTWYHIAVVRYGDTLTMYIDGVKLGDTKTISGSLYNSSAKLAIGVKYGGAEYYSGYIDEFRISKGVARWTSNFTPPISPYPNELLAYSESTIKTQGSYSLKAIAAATDSLNKTLTKTFDPVKDLSGKTQIKYDVRASRTGSNFKIGFHDSGGTTTEHTPNILVAEEWQTETVDISAVSDADKDAIDSAILTILNADSANAIYIDNVRYS